VGFIVKKQTTNLIDDETFCIISLFQTIPLVLI
jgi:hypothetical protein